MITNRHTFSCGISSFPIRTTNWRPHRFIIASLLAITLAGPASSADTRPNVLFIAIDDLRNELGALGAAHARTPQLDSFAKTARVFDHHYVQVPTCGASRCALLRGRYPSVPAHVGNNAIKQTHPEWAGNSLPGVFGKNGYRMLALGKITHHPGGLTGKDWAAGPEELPGIWQRSWIPTSPWKSPEAIMHGYANGVARKPGKSPAIEIHDGPDEAYPDAWIADEAIQTLKTLVEQKEKQPWFFGVGFFKPHLPFAAPKRWHDLHAAGIPDPSPLAAAKPTWPSTFHESGELRRTYTGPPGQESAITEAYARNLRRAYAASISYMDEQVGRVLHELRRLAMEDNTIVVIWGDNGFLLGEHAVWGKHCLFEHALRTPLMIRYPGMPLPGSTCASPVETVDLFPTLTDLCGLDAPDGLDGVSLRPQLKDPATPSAKPARSFWTGGQRTVRDDRWRLVVDRNRKRIELFDYREDPDESRNHAADHPDIVATLLGKLR